jgi:hypothetical protein
MSTADRRQHPRFALSAMYAPIAIRFLDEDSFRHEGHAYDISAGGIRFELDRAIEPGTPVAIRIDLPPVAGAALDIGPGRAVFAFGNVVWTSDDEPGPCRMALAFTRFARAGDDIRLLNRIQSAGVRKAA